MQSGRLTFPSRNRREGFIPIGELLGNREINDKESIDRDKPARAKQAPKARRPRWSKQSLIYNLTAQK